MLLLQQIYFCLNYLSFLQDVSHLEVSSYFLWAKKCHFIREVLVGVSQALLWILPLENLTHRIVIKIIGPDSKCLLQHPHVRERVLDSLSVHKFFLVFLNLLPLFIDRLLQALSLALFIFYLIAPYFL